MGEKKGGWEGWREREGEGVEGKGVGGGGRMRLPGSKNSWSLS